MSDLTEKRMRKEFMRAAPDREKREEASKADLTDIFELFNALGITTRQFVQGLREELKEQAEDAKNNAKNDEPGSSSKPAHDDKRNSNSKRDKK